jgi:bromodomain adjacent to zinc finger domain protein 1A
MINLRDIIEERLEKAATAKLDYRSLKASEGRRERKLLDEKKSLQEEHKNYVAGLEEGSPSKRETLISNSEAILEEKITKLDAQSAKVRVQHLKELKAQVSICFNHQTFLGCDRAFRNHYIFESIPGLFIEHDITYAGKCYDKLVKKNLALAHCTKEQRYEIIKQMVANEESGASDDKEINGADHDKSVTNGKKENEMDMQKDLYMCNCDPVTCVVHSDTPDRIVWTNYNTTEEIDTLIER